MNMSQKCAFEAKKAYDVLGCMRQCCQQAVRGDTSPLFSIGEVTLALCEQ